MKIIEKVVNFFSQGWGFEIIKIYKFLKSTVKYLTLYALLLPFLTSQAVAYLYGEKLPQLAQKIVIEYKLEGHTKFWIEQVSEFFNDSSIEILIGTFIVFLILAILDFLDKIIALKFSQYSLKTNKKYLKNDLQQYIKREIEDKLISSITNNEQTVVITGEEGIGKTILIRQIAQKLSDDYTIHFFISDEWESYNILEKLVYKGQVNDFEKAILKESKDIIIFLDGVNEKNALDASSRIVENYDNQNEEVKQKITLVFTTRDLSSYPIYAKSPLKNYKPLNVEKFTENELEKAIKKLDPNFDYSDFPKKLKSIASIPRYLSLAFKLKSKFSNYENITKEMLYFEGLKEQIKNDPKIRAIGLTDDEDIEEILYDLAQTIVINDNGATVNKDEFKNIFGEEYRKNKTPFQENRIVKKQNIHTIELNFDIVVIAYSFYLMTLFEEIDTKLSITEIADFFKEKLEPYDNDNMTNIPFIVFQLALEKEHSLGENELAKIYAGLFHLWFDNHNSRPSAENIVFWGNKDLKSFIFILDGIEFDDRCNNFSRPSLKDLMLEILSDRWKKSKGKDNELKEYLINLILQDFSEERSRENILHIRRAVKILFAYPTEEFLDIFLEMKENLLNSDIENKEYELEKIYYDLLSVLFRFGYKEDIFEKLISNEKYNDFSKFYKVYSLYNSLQLELNRKLYDCRYCSYFYIKQLIKQKELLKDFTIEKKPHFTHIVILACRKDLEFINNDKRTIINTLIQLSETYIKKEFIDYNIQVIELFLPLLASFDRKLFNQIYQKLLFKTVKQKSLNDIEKFSLVILKNENLADYIIENIDYLLDIENKSDRDRFVDILIEIVLFSTSKEKALEFFNILWERVCITCISYDLLEYIQFFMKEELLSLISNRVEEYHELKNNNIELYESYMHFLYFLNDYKNRYLKEWIIEKSSTWSSEDVKKNELELKIFVSVLSPLYYFNSINAKKTESRFISYWVTKEENIFHEKSVKELIEILPMDSVGKLLYKNNRVDDINIWGVTLFEKNDSFSIMNFLDNYEALEVFANNNSDKFIVYAIKFLNDISTSGINMTGGIKDIIIELLLPLNIKQAIKFFDIEERKDLDRIFIQKLFDTKKFSKKEYQEARKNILLNLKNDLEYLQVTTFALQGSGEEELLNLSQELLSSSYATDRLKAISIIVWIATDKTISILEKLKTDDDSKYVREYARWAEQVSLQEKYVKEIYEEALIETDIEIISAKLYQIKDSLTPTFRYWSIPLHEKYCSGCNRIYIQRFLDKTKSIRKADKKTKVYNRVFEEYYCGEKIDNDFKYITGIS